MVTRLNFLHVKVGLNPPGSSDATYDREKQYLQTTKPYKMYSPNVCITSKLHNHKNEMASGLSHIQHWTLRVPVTGAGVEWTSPLVCIPIYTQKVGTLSLLMCV